MRQAQIFTFMEPFADKIYYERCRLFSFSGYGCTTRVPTLTSYLQGNYFTSSETFPSLSFYGETSRSIQPARHGNSWVVASNADVVVHIQNLLADTLWVILTTSFSNHCQRPYMGWVTKVTHPVNIFKDTKTIIIWTLFRSITLLCGTDNVLWNNFGYFPHSNWWTMSALSVTQMGELCGIFMDVFHIHILGEFACHTPWNRRNSNGWDDI